MFDIEYKESEEREILEAKVSGELTFKAAKQISSETRIKAKKLDYGLLKDLSEMELKISMVDAYNFFDPSENKQLKSSIKSVITAVYVKDASRELWKFWELVSINNGLVSRVFDNKSEAIKWIESKSQKGDYRLN